VKAFYYYTQCNSISSFKGIKTDWKSITIKWFSPKAKEGEMKGAKKE